MKVDGKDLRTIWLEPDEKTVKIIDQRRLPHEFVLVDLHNVDDVITAIKDMYVRGAPLIGATGAYGVYLAALNAPHHPAEDIYLIAECDNVLLICKKGEDQKIKEFLNEAKSKKGKQFV